MHRKTFSDPPIFEALSFAVAGSVRQTWGRRGSALPSLFFSHHSCPTSATTGDKFVRKAALTHLNTFHLHTDDFRGRVARGYAMTYSLLVSGAQYAGLGLMGIGAVALLRLILIHYVQRDWTAEQARTLHALTGLQAAGLLLLTFSAGGLFATHLFETNEFPPLPAFAVQAVLMTVLAASVIFLHVVARPWLHGMAGHDMAARPLVTGVSAHRTLSMTLAFAGLAAAWTLWLVQIHEPKPQPAAMLASLALLTLVLWSVLAIPAVLLRAMAVHALRQEPAKPAPLRTAPLIPEVPQHRHAHIPAPRAPRPRLMMRSDDING